MQFEQADKLDDIATGLGAIVAATDELANDPPPYFGRNTIDALQEALRRVADLVAELEEQRETATP